MGFRMTRLTLLIAAAIIIVSTSAIARPHNSNGQLQGQLQGQAQGQIQGQVAASVSTAVAGQNLSIVDKEAKRVVNAPTSPSIALVNSNVWPCGGFAGLGAQGQYAGITAGGTKDSKNCIAWMLALQETNAAKKEAYLCQMKVHRKAMKQFGTPCKKSRR